MKDKALFFLLGMITITAIYIAWEYSDQNAIAQNPNKESSSQSSDVDEFEGLFDTRSTPENYLKNGNFHSQNKPRRLGIDMSYVDEVESAIWWYDKVLNEYPGTEQVQEALREKIRTLVGWTDGYGDDKEYFGLKNRRKQTKYFPLIESTFLELETGYPDDEFLEAFAYQIAQSYLYAIIMHNRKSLKVNCKEWLEKTIELANGKDTFYSHLSKQRIQTFKLND